MIPELIFTLEDENKDVKTHRWLTAKQEVNDFIQYIKSGEYLKHIKSFSDPEKKSLYVWGEPIYDEKFKGYAFTDQSTKRFIKDPSAAAPIFILNSKDTPLPYKDLLFIFSLYSLSKSYSVQFVPKDPKPRIVFLFPIKDLQRKLNPNLSTEELFINFISSPNLLSSHIPISEFTAALKQYKDYLKNDYDITLTKYARSGSYYQKDIYSNPYSIENIVNSIIHEVILHINNLINLKDKKRIKEFLKDNKDFKHFYYIFIQNNLMKNSKFFSYLQKTPYYDKVEKMFEKLHHYVLNALETQQPIKENRNNSYEKFVLELLTREDLLLSPKKFKKFKKKLLERELVDQFYRDLTGITYNPDYNKRNTTKVPPHPEETNSFTQPGGMKQLVKKKVFVKR